jgi:hypothetical protein
MLPIIEMVQFDFLINYRYTRAFYLNLFDFVMFRNNNGDSVPTVYLIFFDDMINKIFLMLYFRCGLILQLSFLELIMFNLGFKLSSSRYCLDFISFSGLH